MMFETYFSHWVPRSSRMRDGEACCQPCRRAPAISRRSCGENFARAKPPSLATSIIHEYLAVPPFEILDSSAAANPADGCAGGRQPFAIEPSGQGSEAPRLLPMCYLNWLSRSSVLLQ